MWPLEKYIFFSDSLCYCQYNGCNVQMNSFAIISFSPMLPFSWSHLLKCNLCLLLNIVVRIEFKKNLHLCNISYKDLQATEYVYLYKTKKTWRKGERLIMCHITSWLCTYVWPLTFMQISHCFDNSTGLILICKIPSNWCSAHPQRRYYTSFSGIQG